MQNKGIFAAIQGWAELLGRPQVWLAGLAFAIPGSLVGYARGYYLSPDHRDLTMIGAIGLVGAVVSFFIGLVCHFYLSRKLGSDGPGAAPSSAIKWLLLELAVALTVAVPNALIPMALRLLGGLFALYPILIGATAIVIRLIVFPFVVRLVGAVHSGDRHSTATVWRFLMSDPVGWFGGNVLLGVAFWLLGSAVQMIMPFANGDGMAATFATTGFVFGFIQAISFVFAIAAYRALDGSRHGEADVFA